MTDEATFPNKTAYDLKSQAQVGALTPQETVELLEKIPALAELYANDPSVRMDNRDAVRLLLKLRKIEPPLFDLLVAPYDNGYYKKSDGKSTPLSFMKVPRFLRVLGFWKDIVSVRHDLDYYKGTHRKTADDRYREAQIKVGQRSWIAYLEYYGLRLFGSISWRRHARHRASADGYGTDEYIRKLPDKKGYQTSNYLWFTILAGATYFGSRLYHQLVSHEPPLWPEPHLLIPVVLVVLAGMLGAFYLWRESKTSGIKRQTVVGLALSSSIMLLYLISS
jgi:hypothetical protein